MTSEQIPYIVFTVLSAYVLGSISSAILISRAYGMDIRNHGSGNAGLTNTLRILGKKGVFWVFAGDVLKAILAVLIGRILLGEMGAFLGWTFCVIGHIYPIFFGFRGGKGVLSTGAGLLVLDLKMLAIGFAIFLLVVLLTKMVSLGSLLGTGVLIPVAFIWPYTSVARVCVIVVSLLLIIHHKDNIKRIIKGEENKLSFRKKVEE